MPHVPKPFYRTARNAWYVQIGTRQIKLLSGPKTTTTEKAAWDAFHQTMANRVPGQTPSHSPEMPPASISVAELLDKYLCWCEKHRAGRTLAWYKDHLDGFAKSLKSHNQSARTLPAASLRPHHLQDWIDCQAHSKWGSNQKRGAIIAVQRPFNWAIKQGYLDRNPVAGVEKPAAVRRESFITPAEFQAVVAEYSPDDPFRDLLVFLFETGARPFEVRNLEPRHFIRDVGRFEIPQQEAKGKRRRRIIRLTEVAKQIVEKRLETAKSHVFTNEDGNPWTSSAINCRFLRLKRRTGLAHCVYELRHGFCQKKLQEGHDHLTVAELMGHANGQMVSTVYSHMNRAEDHLQKALNSPPAKSDQSGSSN